jgi:hypothetical protein
MTIPTSRPELPPPAQEQPAERRRSEHEGPPEEPSPKSAVE